MKKLNLGSGRDYREGWMNVDVNPEFDPDRVIDLEESNWNLPSGEYDYVLADNVFEHIDPRKRPMFLQECHRLLRENGELVMRWPTPGFGGGWDITHYSIPSWDWPEHPNHENAWSTVDINFTYNRIGSLLPESVARQLMWHGIRTILDVELTITPEQEYGDTW